MEHNLYNGTFQAEENIYCAQKPRGSWKWLITEQLCQIELTTNQQFEHKMSSPGFP